MLGVGAILLRHLSRERTVSELWERARTVKEVGTFERFVLALDLLYALGAVRFEAGLLRSARIRS